MSCNLEIVSQLVDGQTSLVWFSFIEILLDKKILHTLAKIYCVP